MPFFDRNGWQMYYEIHGTGPETIVAIHGNIASTRWWQFLLPFLPSGCRIVMMDLRGCGKSTHTRDGYEISQYVQDIHELLAGLDGGRFHLLGHSMGGQIALAYALRYPQDLQTIALVDSVPADGLTLDDQGRQAFRELQQDKAILRQAVRGCFSYCTDEDVLDELWQGACHCSSAVYHENPETMHATRLIDDAETVEHPVLILHGREDAVIPLATMVRTVQAMPKARAVFLERCGHSPFIERPEAAANIYFGFLHDYGYPVL